MRLLRVPAALLLTLSMPSIALAQYPLTVAPADEMSDEEKIEKAKNLYVQAEGLAAEDNWEAAVVLYEQAYYLVPGKHGFAHKVGIASWKVNDCDKAFDYLSHFIEYGDGEKYPEKIAEAEGIIAEIEEAGCRTIEEAPEPEEPAPVIEEENPFETTPTDTDTGKKDKKKGGKGLLAGGAVLITLGAAGLGVGGAGAAIASGAGTKLNGLSSTGVTGYPAGDYACRGVSGDQCPTDLESQLATGKVLSYAGFIGGGVLLATGVILVVLHVTKKKKASASAKANHGVQLTSIGPALLPGGGGAAASLRF